MAARERRGSGGLIGMLVVSGVLHGAVLMHVAAPVPSTGAAVSINVHLKPADPQRVSAAPPTSPPAPNPAPAVSNPAPAASKPAPAAANPAPAASNPAPAVSTPAPAASKPTPAAPQAAPETPRSPPAATQPPPSPPMRTASAPPVHEAAAPSPAHPPAPDTAPDTAPAPAHAPAARAAQSRAREGEQALLQVRTELAHHFRYPLLARRNGWEGTVVLGFRLTSDGHIDTIEVVRASGHGVLDRAARDALARVGQVPGVRRHPGAEPLYLELPVIYQLKES